MTLAEEEPWVVHATYPQVPNKIWMTVSEVRHSGIKYINVWLFDWQSGPVVSPSARAAHGTISTRYVKHKYTHVIVTDRGHVFFVIKLYAY